MGRWPTATAPRTAGRSRSSPLFAGERLRIRHHGFYVADVANADDLARWIPAAELAQLERDTLILAAWPDRDESTRSALDAVIAEKFDPAADDAGQRGK